MIIIFGKRTTQIAKYSDADHICYHCNAYDREVNVTQDYFHICLIPVFPIGRRDIQMHCRKCGDRTRMESVVQKFDGKSGTPFYLYSFPFLIVLTAIIWFYWHKHDVKQKEDFAGNPVIGDVYTICEEKNNENSFYFLRVAKITVDSVMTLRGNLIYGDFVSQFSKEDYFVKEDTSAISRKALREMVWADELYSVERGYDTDSRFNQIK